MYSLSLLGTISLEGPEGPIEGVVARARPFALLALLASAGGEGWTRTRLVGLLWPERDEDRARHRLADTLYLLRRELGQDAFPGSGDLVDVSPEHVRTDVAMFEARLEEGDLEGAIEVYGGPFLEGFHLPEAPAEFERWVDTKARRLQDRYLQALEELAERAEKTDEWSVAVERWKRLTETDPYNSRYATGLMRALAGSGDPGNALVHADEHARVVREELGARPSGEVSELARRLRTPPSGAAGSEAGTPQALPQGDRHHERRRPAETSDPALAVPSATRESPASALERGPRPRSTVAPLVLSFAGLIILGGALYGAASYFQIGSDVGEGMTEIHSLAVLPLENLSGDPSHRYFTDGMTEALTTELGQITALTVSSRTSAMQFRDVEKTLPEIAQDLGVDALITGSVFRAESEVRITIQLVHGTTDRHVWSDSYEGDLADILALQAEVASAVADEIRVAVTPSERARLAERQRVDPEAYQAYLRGRYLINRWPASESDRCEAELHRAIQQDPNFADAHAALAMCYVGMSWSRAPDQVHPSIREAAQKALELDPNQSDAHAALAATYLFYDWDWAAADEHLRRALELQPNNSSARILYSDYLVFMGKSEEGIRQAQRAVELDPVSFLTNRNLAFVYQLSRRYEDYATQARATLDLGPGFGWARHDLAWALAFQRRTAEALEEIREGGFPDLIQAILYGTLGAERPALEQIERVIPLRDDAYVDSFWIGAVFGSVGHADEAIRWLNQGYEEHSASMVQLKTYPGLDPLRDDPRFQELLGRMDFLEP